VTVPETPFGPAATAKVEAFTDAGSIDSEKVAVMFAFTSTLSDAADGVMLATVGGAVSGAGSVVNVQTKFAARWFPATSCTPVVTTAV
jgi:hypothetical protein